MKMLYCLTLCGLVALSGAVSAISFTPGHLYSTSYDGISEYDANGVLLSSLDVGDGRLRGLAFGPDGYLYIVQHHLTAPGLYPTVNVYDHNGNVIRSQTFAGLTNGLSFGKIAFDNSGENFYVGALDGLYKFSRNGSEGSRILSVDMGVEDVDVLPNGDLLVVDLYAIYHYTSAGVRLGKISTLDDPYNITPDDYPRLDHAIGVVYDPVTDSTFVNMYGYSGGSGDMSDKILRLDGLTNTITGMTTNIHSDDMFLTSDHCLIVGSSVQRPCIFSTDLSFLGEFTGPDARFVTEMPVPEPSALAAILSGLGIVFILRGKRR